MTSKELLEHIKNAPAFKGGDTRYTMVSNSATQYDADIKQIEKDLEMLAQIKNILLKNGPITNIERAESLMNVKIVNGYLFMTDNEIDSIKEWLEEEYHD